MIRVSERTRRGLWEAILLPMSLGGLVAVLLLLGRWLLHSAGGIRQGRSGTGVNRQKGEETMNKREKTRMRKKALWAAEALGIVLAYFGAFALLMYPVLDAAGYVA